MIVVRTVVESDIDGVLALAHEAFPGMTTLPPDRPVLAAKLEASVRSIAKMVRKPSDETYFLVMEDTAAGRIVGTAAIIACLGTQDEFYSYKLNKETCRSKSLDKKVSFQTLNLSNHFEGFSEVATLYLSEDYRKHGNGKLLAKSRYLFMRQFRERFPESVMADLRGYFDDYGRSPFWNAVGKHFFEMEFAEADLYGAVNGNQFIADLMPKHPIYVNMLPKEAQQVIGQPNVKGKPALQMLINEGFVWNGHVDIFDAAPSVDTLIDEIATIQQSKVAPLLGEMQNEAGETAIVAGSDIHRFRACYSVVNEHPDGVCLPSQTIDALGLKAGDLFRYTL